MIYSLPIPGRRLAALFPLSLMFACAVSGQNATDSRFGTVGNSNHHWQWYRHYNQDYYSLPAPPVLAPSNRLYTVGKLDDPNRSISGGGDWCTDQARPDLFNCDRISQTEKTHREKYSRILEYDKAGIRHLVRRFNRDYKQIDSEYGYNGAQKIHIAVGNEPNFHPYVHPRAYASAFKQYYDFIKGPTPAGLNCASCVVHTGGLLLGDFTIYPGPETMLDVVLTVHLTIAGTIANLANKRLDHFTWTWQFLDELVAGLGGRFDIFNVHPYEVDYEWNGLYVQEDGRANLRRIMPLIRGGVFHGKTVATNETVCYDQEGDGKWEMHLLNGRRLTVSEGIPAYFRSKAQCQKAAAVISSGGKYVFPFPWTIPNPVVWADEFGALLVGADENLIKTYMERYVADFKASPFIHRWFWFKTFGNDPKFDPLELSNQRGRLGRFSLCIDEACTQVNGLGQKYLSLQDPAYQNYNYPRLSFDLPNTADYLRIPAWSNDPSNLIQVWDFSNSADVTAWHSGTYNLYKDGFTYTSQCANNGIARTLTEAEIQIANQADFFVVERGPAPPDDGTTFRIWLRNQSTKTATTNKVISNFAKYSTIRNELADQGQPLVLSLRTHVPPDQEIYRIEQNFLIPNCYSGSYTHAFGRAYFSVNNPVPSVGSTPNSVYYTGVLLEKEVNAGLEVMVPVNLNTNYCSNCVLALDGGSVAKGMTISGQEIRWKPSMNNVGVHKAVLTSHLNGKQLASKEFRVIVKKPKFNLSFLSLLFD